MTLQILPIFKTSVTYKVKRGLVSYSVLSSLVVEQLREKIHKFVVQFINDYSEFFLSCKMLGKPDELLRGSLGMNLHFIQGRVVLLLVSSLNMETGISFSWISQ